MRVTNRMMIDTVLRDLFNNNRRAIRLQDQIATGRIVNNPSEDPLISDQVIGLDTRIARAVQYIRNGQAGTSFLSLADSTLGDVNDLATSARTLAVKMANDTQSATTRSQASGEVDQILAEVVDLANRRFRDRYIFGGHETMTVPFEITAGGDVRYNGDMAHVKVQLTENAINQVSVNGADVFNAFDAAVTGIADLDPALDLSVDATGTRLSELNGGGGVTPGSIRIIYGGGTVADVDLTTAETVEDVATIINDATGLAVAATAAGDALQISGGGGPISVQELGGGSTARELGILGSAAGPLLVGTDVDPAVTSHTKITSLLGGAGLDPSGFTINNGGASQTFLPAAWNTVGDMLEALNASGVDIYAEINPGGDGLNVYSRLNGATMTITENGGNTAADLGILEVAGVRADNLFTSLMDLSADLQANDRAGISNAITLIDNATDELLKTRAEIGARVQRTEAIKTRQEDEEYNLTALLSETNDLDYSRAAMDFQNLRNVMDAALSMAAQTLPRSLADFL